MYDQHISIEKLRRRHIAEATEVLAQAFYSNPIPMLAFGHLSDAARLTRVRRIYRNAVETAMISGHTYIVRREGLIVATAIAYSPVHKLIPQTREWIQTIGLATAGLSAVTTYGKFARHYQKIRPNTPHWRIEAVGVAPSFQRKGIGQALVNHFNRIADMDGVETWLETTREDQIPFYSALGFQLEGLSSVKGLSDISVRQMRRAPTSDT